MQEDTMNITRYTPFRDFGNLLGNWRLPLEMDEFTGQEGRWLPSVEISESDDQYLVKLEIPEVKKKDLEVEVADGMLTIRGERRMETTDQKKHRTERFYGSFERSFSLPDDVQEQDIAAEQKDGMLYISLRKSDLKKPARKLEIKAS
jgi:HSP20 family protein